MEELQLVREGTPFDKRFMARSISRRSVCRIITAHDDWYGVIMGLYKDGDRRWLQAVNISDAFDEPDEAPKDLANIIVDMDKLVALEFSDDSVDEIETLSDDELVSIKSRTLKIVEAAKQALRK